MRSRCAPGFSKPGAQAGEGARPEAQVPARGAQGPPTPPWRRRPYRLVNPLVPGKLPGIRLRSGSRGSGSNSAEDECAVSLRIAILHKFSSWGWFSAQSASVRVNAASG